MLTAALLVLMLVLAFGAGYSYAMSRTFGACAGYWRRLGHVMLFEQRDPEFYDHARAFHEEFDPLRTSPFRRMRSDRPQADDYGPKGDTNGG